MNHAAITRAMHSRLTLTLSVIVTLIGVGLAYWLGGEPPMPRAGGLVAGWGEPLSLPPWVGIGVALALNGAIVAFSYYLNKTYNLLRAMTYLSTALFLLIELATPLVLMAPTSGLLLCLVVLACMALMYGVYTSGHCDTRKVFLVQCMLSAGASVDYAYILYVPIFVLACIQLRFFNLRCAVASLLGLATPWIIFLGFGIVLVDQLQWPQIELSVLGSHSGALVQGTVLFTGCITIGAWLQNVMKIITYNARSRSLLSVITIVTLITVAAAVIDMTHLMSYIVMLNWCAAFQIAHMFVAIHNFEKSYIGVLAVVVIYLMICSWTMIALI